MTDRERRNHDDRRAGDALDRDRAVRQQQHGPNRLIDELAATASERRSQLFDGCASYSRSRDGREMIVHPVARAEDGGDGIVHARLDEEPTSRPHSRTSRSRRRRRGFSARPVEFRTRLLAHAEAEERDEFRLLDANVDHGRLQKMAGSVLRRRSRGANRTPPASPESGIGTS